MNRFSGNGRKRSDSGENRKYDKNRRGKPDYKSNSQDSEQGFRKRTEKRRFSDDTEFKDKPQRKSFGKPKSSDSFERPYKKTEQGDNNKPKRSFSSDTFRKKMLMNRDSGNNRSFRPSNNDFSEKRDHFQDDRNKENFRSQKTKFKPVYRESDEEKSDDGFIRLNKYISNAGICSRREADELIQSGKVKVNGKIITELGSKVLLTDTVTYKGKTLIPERKVYILMNKPKDCVTTTDDPEARRTVFDMLKGSVREQLHAVGRLDRNTTGVLLLTNDGEMTQKLTHPKFSKSKIYHVWLDRNLSDADFREIKQGITLEDGFIRPDDLSYVEFDDKTQIGIEIHSGQNRVVRRIFEYLEYKVLKLDRVYFAGLTKKGLARGDWRYLTDEEVSILKRIS